MNTNSPVCRMHPFIIFWIGILTGALVVGLIFLYNFLNSEDFTSALLRLPKTTKTQQVTNPTTKKTNTTGDASTQSNTRAIGGPGPVF